MYKKSLSLLSSKIAIGAIFVDISLLISSSINTKKTKERTFMDLPFFCIVLEILATETLFSRHLGARRREIKNIKNPNLFFSNCNIWVLRLGIVSKWIFPKKNLQLVSSQKRTRDLFKWYGKATKIWHLIFHRIWKKSYIHS